MSRLFIYSDAVVAISVTLLITIVLKLKPPTPDEGFWEALLGQGGMAYLLAFGLSFGFITHFWRNNLAMTDGLRTSSARLITINCFWLGTIAFLPLPTYWFAASTSSDPRGELSFYLLCVAAVGLVGLVQAQYLQHHPELFDSPNPERRLTDLSGTLFEFLLVMAAATQLIPPQRLPPRWSCWDFSSSIGRAGGSGGVPAGPPTRSALQRGHTPPNPSRGYSSSATRRRRSR